MAQFKRELNVNLILTELEASEVYLKLEASSLASPAADRVAAAIVAALGYTPPQFD